MNLPVKLRMMAKGCACNGDVVRADALARAAIDADRLTEENARLREALEQSSEVLRRQLSQYYYKDEVSMLKQYESNKQLLNQLKDQNNDK